MAWQSTHNAQKSKKVDSSMDCHADKSARNDRNNAQALNELAQDSRIFDNKAPNVSDSQAEAKLDSSKSPSDSKILDEKCGLQGKSQGSYLSGNDRRDFSPLPHFSLKAESPQVDSSNDYSASAECIDCHDFASAKSRNNGKNAKNVSKQPKDSRICDEKFGLLRTVQGRALGVRNRRESAEIADLSRKAESTNEQPTPLDSMSVFGYAIDGSLKLICYISDEPKDGAKELVAYLQSNGKQVVLLSGDRAGAVESVARSLGIEGVS